MIIRSKSFENNGIFVIFLNIVNRGCIFGYISIYYS